MPRMEMVKRKKVLKEASLDSASVAEAAIRHQLAKVSFWEKVKNDGFYWCG